MSKLLDEIIKQRKQNTIKYEEYLTKMAELAKKVAAGKEDSTPDALDTPAKRALWNNLGKDELLAIKINKAILGSRNDGWRGNPAKENLIKQAIYSVLNNEAEVERIFSIVKQQQGY